MATVRMPRALAAAATTGAAPLPVPPPIPACIQTLAAFIGIEFVALQLAEDEDVNIGP